jgi:DNA replication protein DnaC
MQRLGQALAPLRERLRERFPQLAEETAEERAERLKLLPPTEKVDQALSVFAAAARDLPAVGAVKARARIEKKIAELEEQHRQCVERDVTLAEYPDGCFCFGTGGRGRCAYNGRKVGEFVELWAEFCPCPVGQAQLAELNEIRRERAAWDRDREVERALKEHMQVPGRLKPFTLESWAQASLERGNDPAVVAKLLADGHRWIEAEARRWLVLWGLMGVGKTGYAAGLLNALAARGITCVLISTPDLLGEIKATYDAPRGGKTEQDIINAARAAPLLLLDDVGAHYTKEEEGWAAEVLYRIVNGRYDDGAPMILTCNLRPGSNLEERLGRRSYDRLVEVADFVQVEGPSLRRAPALTAPSTRDGPPQATRTVAGAPPRD